MELLRRPVSMRSLLTQGRRLFLSDMGIIDAQEEDVYYSIKGGKYSRKRFLELSQQRFLKKATKESKVKDEVKENEVDKLVKKEREPVVDKLKFESDLVCLYDF